MDVKSGNGTVQTPDAAEGQERYSPKVWHRFALLVLIYVAARYLDGLPGPGRLFDILVALAAAYTAAISLIAPRLRVRPWLVLSADLSLIVGMCMLTGGVSSLVKYFGLAYFYLLSPYIASPRMKAFLLVYSVAVTLLVLQGFGTGGGPPLAEAARASVLNLFVLNGAGWPSVLLSEYIHRLRTLQRETAITFHSLNSALHLRTQNLQTAHDALTQAHEKLKQADENKTRLLSSVSHELRTPLSSVRSFTEILMSYDDLDRQTQKEFLGIIHDESRRLNLLINDILDVVRLESGRVELHLARVDMDEVIRNTVKTLMPMAVEKGLRLEFVEPEGRTPWVKGDKNQLTQVMVNLVNNAIKFTAAGGITVSTSLDESDVVVSVADTGEGVYPEEREKIFDEFFRVADNVDGRPAGSGLGLSISRKILELHGGRIWVEGEMGKGSDFRFTVPVDIDDIVPAPRSGPDLPVAERKARERPTVLVAEENSTIRQLMRKRLEESGYSTLGAGDGSAAFKLATEWEPDCILSGMHSFAARDINLYSGLRTHPKTAEAAVILTCMILHPAHGLQVAVNGFIQRPIDRYGLIRTMEACVRHARGPVLVISPDRLEARTIQLILGNGGYDVTLSEESTWREAAGRRVPAAFILDGTLPAGTVRDIIGGIRSDQNKARVPVILVTEAPVGDGGVSAATLRDGQYDPGVEIIAPVMDLLRGVAGGVSRPFRPAHGAEFS